MRPSSTTAVILDVPPCYFYIDGDNDTFAYQVLILYKTNSYQKDEFEEELITTLLEYEKAMNIIKNTANSIKSIKERVIKNKN
ncbi:transcriptional regulator [Xenorhabdus eapokensis]|uniref:Transcriptional regulator n=1 Tax=Xenorhabdus eapokensis TaxID=1873482 RepID=A0A1Q5TWQ1_9GAMM|nr:transcriptional regulator [Xenorhabdus eapokensis]